MAALDHDVGDRTLSPYALFQELDPVLDFCVVYLPRGLNESGRLIPKISGCFCFCFLPLALLVVSPKCLNCLLELLGNRCQQVPWVSIILT